MTNSLLIRGEKMEKVYTWKQLLRRYILGVCLKFLVFLLAALALWILLHEGVYGAMMVLYGWLPVMCALSALGLCYSLVYLVTLLKNKTLSGNSQAVKALYTKKEKLTLRIFTAVCAVIVAFVIYVNAYFVFFYQNPKSAELKETFSVEKYTTVSYSNVPPHMSNEQDFNFFSTYMFDWYESYSYGVVEMDGALQEQETAGGSVSVFYLQDLPQWLIDREFSRVKKIRLTNFSVFEYTDEDEEMLDTIHDLQYGEISGFWREFPMKDGQMYRVTLFTKNQLIDVLLSVNSGELDLDKLIEEAVAQMQSA